MVPPRRTLATLALTASLAVVSIFASGTPAHAEECGLLGCSSSGDADSDPRGDDAGRPSGGAEEPTTASPVDITPARLLAMVNQVRADHGLAGLAHRDDVAVVADAHSADMAAAGTIWHNDDYFSSASRDRLGASILAENVAKGPDLETIHRRLLDSPGHRANLLDDRLTVAGFGVVASDGGTLYVTQAFLRPAAATSPITVVPAAAPSNAATTPSDPGPGATAPVDAPVATPTGSAEMGTLVLRPVAAAITPPSPPAPASVPARAPWDPDQRWVTLAGALLAMAGISTDVLRRRCDDGSLAAA